MTTEIRAYMSLGKQIVMTINFDNIPRDLIHDIIVTTFDKLGIEINDKDAIRLHEWRLEKNNIK